MKVGDLVFVKPAGSMYLRNEVSEANLKGIIHSQIDEDWFRVYITWGKSSRITDFPRCMLEVITIES